MPKNSVPRKKVKSVKRRIVKPKPQSRKPTNTTAPNPECPYRPTSMYGVLYVEGSRGYIARDELIKKVAKLTGKSEKLVGFGFQVLRSPTHRSNKNRSTVIEEDGRIKLIAIRK
jgi:hypothetical protein